VLICSQVALSFGIPFALIPLLLVTRDRAIMGDIANKRITSAAMLAVTAVITGLNATLIGQLAAALEPGQPKRIAHARGSPDPHCRACPVTCLAVGTITVMLTVMKLGRPGS
jgi:hypothetical protein